jgi:CMP-N-acetylneuraminic acid synthetase
MPNRWIVIPCRQGSQGVPNKSLRPLGGRSIVERALLTAKAIKGDIIVSTDYPLAMLPYEPKYRYDPRPEALATSTASMWDVLNHLAVTFMWADKDVVVLLQPTSLHKHRAHLILAALGSPLPAVSTDHFPDRWHPAYAISHITGYHPPICRQRLPIKRRPNGLFYLMTGKTARDRTFWAERPKLIDTPGTINIDTEADWQLAEAEYGNLP